MQLDGLVKPIDNMSDEELRERLYALRHRRETEKPKQRKIVEKAAKKETRKKVSAAEKLLEGLTPEQLDILLKGLE